MHLSLLLLVSALASDIQTSGLAAPIDVSAIKVGAPTIVAELDLGKLKGDLRRVAWSAEGTELYILTVEGNPPSEKLRHYVVAVTGGPVSPVDAAPEWADSYWRFKSDRSAPGHESLMIDVAQGIENIKVGTGSAGALDRSSSPAGAGNINSDANLDRALEKSTQHVVRLTLLGETISEFVNERPIPGLTFGWAPPGAGAIAFTNREGRLMLLDVNNHKQTVQGVKDALLPAWSPDGTRLAYVQKTGRKKYNLLVAPLQR